MQRVGVVFNPFSPDSTRVSLELARWLEAEGVHVWRGVSHEGRAEPELLHDVDLLVALGGDGTMLRAALLGLILGVPIVGIALGHLSFMAELSIDEMHWGLRKLLKGDFWRDERSLVQATLVCQGVPVGTYTGLNEIALLRRDIGRTLEVEVEVYGAPLTTYHADGVLVATATGSTAYALAAGGPIVDPRSQAIVLVSVAAHLTNVPHLVLHEDARVTLWVRGRHPAVLTIDGREGIAVNIDDFVRVRRSPEAVVFARVQPPEQFYTRLSARLRRD